MSRITIPDETASEVMFLADRTCCVCRDPRRKTEIHHVDGDASNNTIGNLALLCKDCHSDAHTTQAFARNLTPALLRKYNDSWRGIVALRIRPGGEEAEALEYRSQVLLELSLCCHRWANRLMDLYTGPLDQLKAIGESRWDYLAEAILPTYSKPEWERFQPLFDRTSEKTAAALEGIVLTYGDALRPRTKVGVLRTASSVRAERLGYLQLPRILVDAADLEPDHFFQYRFAGTVSVLGSLATATDEERSALTASRSHEHSAPFVVL